MLRLDASRILKTGLVASRITAVPYVHFICHCLVWHCSQQNRLLCCCAGGICQVGGVQERGQGGCPLCLLLKSCHYLSSKDLVAREVFWWWVVLSFPTVSFHVCFHVCCNKHTFWFLWNGECGWFVVLQIQWLALVELPLQLVCLGYRRIVQFLCFLHEDILLSGSLWCYFKGGKGSRVAEWEVWLKWIICCHIWTLVLW